MEPITVTIATALALGAAAGLQGIAEQTIKDAYDGLKKLIQSRYAKVNLAQLEEAPESKARRAVVDEDLAKAGADHDEEVLRHAKALMDLVRDRKPEAAGAIGVDLEDVKGASLRIANVIASGAGVRARRAEIDGDIDISGVRAGVRGDNSAKNS